MREKAKKKNRPDSLFPRNRAEVYWDVLRHRFLDLAKISLLSGLFFLPLFV